MAGGAPVLAARLRKRDSVHGNGGNALPLPFCLRHSKHVHMISLEVRTDSLPSQVVVAALKVHLRLQARSSRRVTAILPRTRHHHLCEQPDPCLHPLTV